MGIFKKFFDKLKYTFKKTELDDDFYDELESILVSSDMGVETAMDIMDELRDICKDKLIKDTERAQVELKNLLIEKLNAEKVEFSYPLIITIVGVNGVGKTTSIAKIAHSYKKQGKKVLLAAGDTFRAGAIEQLTVWAKRVGVDIVTKEAGSDPSSVIFDACKKAKEGKYDLLLCDTAGRLQNKVNLMNELSKMKRVIENVCPGSPEETLLVIDATTGQNGMSQAKAFKEATDVSGVILTKLDGTSKGGIVLAIRHEMGIPIKYVGLGEAVEDLEIFDIEQYLYGLFADFFEE